MNPGLPRLQRLAGTLLESERQGDGVQARITAAEQVLRRLAERIGPLVGIGGYHLLLQRALKRTRTPHPWLTGIHLDSGAPWRLSGASEAASATDPGEIDAALRTLISELIGLLARFLGADMTIRLVRQCFPSVLKEDDPAQGFEETTDE